MLGSRKTRGKKERKVRFWIMEKEGKRKRDGEMEEVC